MIDQTNHRRREIRWLLLSAFALGAFAIVPQSFSQINLTSGNSSFQVTTSGAGSGATSWTVDGVNPLNLQWFWFRAGGMTSEQRIDTISSAAITVTSPFQARVTYANSNYSVSVDYTLNGQAAGSGLSTLVEGITIKNNSASALDFTFFQYSDFNLFGGGAGDGIAIGKDLHGLFGNALQTNGPIRLAETSLAPGANRAEANVFHNTLDSLNDGGITTLNNVQGAGPGNVTWAFEWDFTGSMQIGAGASVGISKTLDVVVPEPSVAALFGCAVVACAAYRRRKH